MKLAAFALLLCAGCAVNSHRFETIEADGSSRSLTVKTYATWPASTSIDKQRTTLGKTFSVGSSGLSEDGGGTNLTAALDSLTRLMQALRP